MAKQAGTGLPVEVVDVYLSTQDQIPGPHTSSQGRITSLVNGEVRHYAGPGQPGERVVVDQRKGFSNLTNAARDVASGDTVVPPVSNPELLHGLADQLVSVSNSVPRVYAGLTPGWSAFPAQRYLSQSLDESVYHTTDNVLEVPSGTVAGDACGFVWTDTSYDDDGQPIQATFFAVKSVSLGTWILTPQLLFQGVTNTYRTRAQLVTDGSFFWVFWNSTPPDLISVNVYDQSGVLLAFSSVTPTWVTTSPGYWDVTYQGATVLLCQPGANGPGPGELHVKYSKFTRVGAVITVTEHVDTTSSSQGPVMWITNDNDSTKAYLASYGPGSPGTVFTYQVDPTTLTQTHQNSHGTPLSLPDAFAGYVTGSGPFGEVVAWTTLASSSAVGPKFDPATRQTVSSIGRANNSVALVSRAFKIGTDYYANTYYQSGSGQTLAESPIAVTLAGGDTFIGNGIQKVPVQAGDYTTGAPFVVGGRQINPANAQTVRHTTGFTQGISAGDTVQVFQSDGTKPVSSINGPVPAGQQFLKWKFAGFASTDTMTGTMMTVSGSSGVTGADGVYQVSGIDLSDATVLFTYASSTNTFPVGTFGAAGTATGAEMFGYSAGVTDFLQDNTILGFFIGGTIDVSGAGGLLDGLKTISYLVPSIQSGNGTPDMFYSVASGVGFSTNVWSGTVSPLNPGKWHFSFGPTFDSSLDGSLLSVTGAAKAPNNGVFTITAGFTGELDTTDPDASALQPEVFTSPPPSMEIDLAADQTPYTFTIASLTTDYTFYNAQVQVGNSPDAVNDGVYKITWLDPTNSHRFQAFPTNGLTNQVSQNLTAPTTVTIVKAVAVQPELQPMWYLTPISNNRQPQIGCYERGLAYADWKIEGDSSGPDLFPCSLSNVFNLDQSGTGLGWLLPFRAKAVTAGQQVVVGSNIIETSQESTIGLKLFKLLAKTGHATEAFQELVMPGPLAGGFTSSGFQEQGMLVGPETPFLVGESNDTGAFGITPGTIFVQAVWEATDDNGERVWSYPSAPMQYVLEPGNNTAVYGGRSPLPYLTSGVPSNSVFGLTNRTHITLSLYRTATIQGVPTTQLYKITNDLNPNGLYTSGVGSGFTFPDLFTWNYRDQSIDAAIVNQEPLYTSKGQLPRFPGPPNKSGCVWQNRTWLAGYDGVVWMSGDKQEGDSNWFFPGYRILAGNDKVLSVSPMEQYLVLGAERGMWYLPAQRFPDNTGSGGNVPTPSLLPFPNGCTGLSVSIDQGVAYSSTAGGVWLITRDLKNLWLSEPVKDSLVGNITDLAVDSNQRLCVANGTNQVFVYDPIPKVWYTWTVPNAVIKLTSWLGSFTYQDASSVMQQLAGFCDNTASGQFPYCPDVTLALLLFAQARAVKQCWGLQIVGTFQGPHNLNASISYPDDPGEAPTTFGPFTPTNAVPYVYEINPKVEEASSYLVRVFGTPTGTGNSFSLELIGAEVGVDSRQGTFKAPPSSRITAA